MDDDQDQDLFYDYLLTNLKLYFDKFEEELEASPDEPTTPEYEEESSVTGDEAEALQEEVNPWAICTAKVGRKDKAKYEACVLAVKDEHGIAH